MDLFSDRLLAAIARKGAPVCAGIDPMVDMMPDPLLNRFRKGGRWDAESAVDATFEFTTRILKLLAEHVPVVKFQSAYFEQFMHEGVEAYYSLVQEASDLGLLVIGDVKRGDIGSTVAAYSAGHLADHSAHDFSEVVTPDAITVNPMLGLDTIQPFVDTAKTFQKGLFVLVRTSNPGSAKLQDVKLADGRTWSEMLADELRPTTEMPGMVGACGYSAIGAVVGATQAHTMISIRQRLPKSIFLLPGYGAQGATAEMTKAAFTDGKGAIISASRSILYAHRDKKYADRFGADNWERCVEQAVLDMKQDVRQVLGM
jgi:orotidine-5'-phosphate decarboxylase